MRSSFLAARSKFFARIGSGIASKSRSGWRRDDLEPEIGRHEPRVAGLAAEEGQIVLEDLDRAKAGLGRGGEFVLQRAAHADRGDRPSEHLSDSYASVSCL